MQQMKIVKHCSTLRKPLMLFDSIDDSTGLVFYEFDKNTLSCFIVDSRDKSLR